MRIAGNRPESYEHPSRVAEPYTHERHAQRCHQAALSGCVIAGQPVQVLKRGAVYCARLVHAWTTDGGLDCWTVDATLPEQCRMTVPVRQVRQCGGFDCSCYPDFEAGRGAESEARAAAGRALEGVTCL